MIPEMNNMLRGKAATTQEQSKDRKTETAFILQTGYSQPSEIKTSKKKYLVNSQNSPFFID